MAGQSFEGGVRPDRTEFIRESTAGSYETDPSWNRFSDTVTAFEASINPQPVARQGMGDPDTDTSHVSVEASEATVTYDLNQWLVDGSGNGLDAAYDAFARDTDNRLPNTHTVVSRMDQSDLEAGNTHNGSTSHDTRQYFVGVGGRLDGATISLSPSDTAVWQVECTYLFERARSYQIDQPDSSTELTVKSTDSSDTNITVTIEDEGASTTEDVSTDGSDGTTVQSTSSTFGDIDAVEVTADTTGDIVVSINDGTSSSPTEGDELARIHGSDSFDHNESEDGVPALGSGSHATSIGSLELAFDGDTIERPSGTSLFENVGTHEISVSNNVESGARATTPFPSLSAGARNIEISSTAWGETVRYDQEVEMLQTTQNDYVWTPASGDSLTVGNVNVLEVGASKEAAQGRMEIDVTMGQQQSVTIS